MGSLIPVAKWVSGGEGLGRSVEVGDPCGDLGVRGHAPVPARREGHEADLGAVHEHISLVLVREEPADEDPEPLADFDVVVDSVLVRHGPADEDFRGEAQDGRRREAEADQIVAEEVMELVRPHLGLGLLLDPPLSVRAQELGADRGVEHVVEHGAHVFLVYKDDVRRPLDQVADQGLRHTTIHVVVANVVAEHRAPADQEFGEISGSEDQGAVLGRMDQLDEHPAPGLGVLERQVLNVLVMVDD